MSGFLLDQTSTQAREHRRTASDALVQLEHAQPPARVPNGLPWAQDKGGLWFEGEGGGLASRARTLFASQAGGVRMARQRLAARSREKDGDDETRCKVVFKSSFADDDDGAKNDDNERDEVENLMKGGGADVQQMQRRVRTLKVSLNESTGREEALRRNYAALSGAHAKLKEQFETAVRDLQSTEKERERLVDKERRKAQEVAVLTKEVGYREQSDAEAAELRAKCTQMLHDLKAKNVELDKVNRRVHDAEMLVKTSQSKRREAEMERASLQVALTKSESKLGNTEERRVVLEKQLGEATRALTKAERQRADDASEIEQLRRELALARSEKASMAKSALGAHGELENVASALRKAVSEREELRQRDKEAGQRTKAMESDKTLREDELRRLTSVNGELSRQCAELTASLEGARSTLAATKGEFETKLADQNDEVTNLREALSESVRERNLLNDEVSTLGASTSQLQNQLCELQARSSQDASDASIKLHEVQLQLDTTKLEMRDERARLQSELRASIHERESQLKSADTRLESAMQKLNSYESHAEARFLQLRDLLDNLTVDYVTKSASMSRVMESCSREAEEDATRRGASKQRMCAAMRRLTESAQSIESVVVGECTTCAEDISCDVASLKRLLRVGMTDACSSVHDKSSNAHEQDARKGDLAPAATGNSNSHLPTEGGEAENTNEEEEVEDDDDDGMKMVAEMETTSLRATSRADMSARDLRRALQSIRLALADVGSEAAAFIERNRRAISHERESVNAKEQEMLRKNAEAAARSSSAVTLSSSKKTTPGASEEDLHRTISQLMKAESSIESAVTCLACLEIFNSPVTCTPCGHNVCRSCITSSGAQEEGGASLLCPECGETVSSHVENQALDILASKQVYRKKVLNDLLQCSGTNTILT